MRSSRTSARSPVAGASTTPGDRHRPVKATRNGRKATGRSCSSRRYHRDAFTRSYSRPRIRTAFLRSHFACSTADRRRLRRCARPRDRLDRDTRIAQQLVRVPYRPLEFRAATFNDRRLVGDRPVDFFEAAGPGTCCPVGRSTSPKIWRSGAGNAGYPPKYSHPESSGSQAAHSPFATAAYDCREIGSRIGGAFASVSHRTSATARFRRPSRGKAGIPLAESHRFAWRPPP